MPGKRKSTANFNLIVLTCVNIAKPVTDLPIWRIFSAIAVFAHICANRRKSREAHGNIARRVSVCQLSASDRYSDKDESKSSAWTVRFGFFVECAIFHGIRITSNTIPIFRKCDCMICSRFFFVLSAGISLERVKKVIVCFARRVLYRVFPDPEMSAFLAVIILQRVIPEFSHLMRRHVGYMSELQAARETNGQIYREIILS